jgi:hypothetical protein
MYFQLALLTVVATFMRQDPVSEADVRLDSQETDLFCGILKFIMFTHPYELDESSLFQYYSPIYS